MATNLPPVPRGMTFLDQAGNVTSPWLAFFDALRTRAGGSTGQSTSDLKSLTTQLEAQISSLNAEIADIGKGRAL